MGSLCLMATVLLYALFLKIDVHVFHKPYRFLSQRSNLSLLPLPPYAFVFSFVLLKRINILEGILSPAFLSFHHLPLRETLKASALLLLEEKQLSVLWHKAARHIFLWKSSLLHTLETEADLLSGLFFHHFPKSQNWCCNDWLMLKCSLAVKLTGARWHKQFCLRWLGP